MFDFKTFLNTQESLGKKAFDNFLDSEGNKIRQQYELFFENLKLQIIDSIENNEEMPEIVFNYVNDMPIYTRHIWTNFSNWLVNNGLGFIPTQTGYKIRYHDNVTYDKVSGIDTVQSIYEQLLNQSFKLGK